MGAGVGSLIGLGLGAAGLVGKIIARNKANHQLGDLMGQDPSYAINPLAQQRLGLAQTLLNARMPGAAQVQQNLYSNYANKIGTINRGATDASQALLMGAQAGGQTDEGLNQLGINEAQDYQRRYGNLVGAQEGMINEGDKVYNDQVRRFGDRVQMTGAQAENRGNTWSDIANLGFGVADLGFNGAFNNMFKKGAATVPNSQLTANGTYGYQGYLNPQLYNRRTPNFGY